MKRNFKKSIFLVLLLVLCMSVAVAADASEDTQKDVVTTTHDAGTTHADTPAIETAQKTKHDNTIKETKKSQQRHVPGNPDTFENENLDIVNDSYDGHTLTLLDNVNVQSSNNQPLHNISFIIQGNNVNIQNLDITNVNQNNVVIKVINSSNNINILNNNITTISDTTPNPVEVKAIKVEDSSSVVISGNTMNIAGVPQENNWIRITETPSHSVDTPFVDAVEAWNSDNIYVNNNNITVTNSTISNITNSTGKAVVFNNNTRNSTIYGNKINIDGFDYIHAVSLCYEINRVYVRFNDITMNGTNYVGGVFGDYVTYSTIEGNNITGNCHNTSSNIASNESMAYGINIFTEDAFNLEDAESVGVTIAYNNITLNSTIAYGIEDYFVESFFINHNNITADANKAVGIAISMQKFCDLSSNNIQIHTSDDRTLRNVYELIPPITSGILCMATTDNNFGITNNIINITESASSDYIYTIRLHRTNVTSVSGNYLGSTFVGGSLEANDSIYNNTNWSVIGENYPLSSLNTVNSRSISLNNKLIKSSANKAIKTSAQVITLNATNFETYVTNHEFNDNVNDGDVIDIDGKLDGGRFQLNVNKAVNITSLKNNSYIECGQFNIVSSGSNSNISNLNFVNTFVSVKSARNVIIDNITSDNGAIQRRGQFVLGSQSNNCTVKNSFFRSWWNGGLSCFVLAGCTNCLIENNTVIGEGRVGNLFSLNMGADDAVSTQIYTPDNYLCHHVNITIRNNLIEAKGSESDISYGLYLEGMNILVENNTVIHRRQAVDNYYGKSYNVTFINNHIPYGNFINRATSHQSLINNTLNTVYSVNDSVIINNTINTLYTANNNTVDNNNIKNIKITNNNTIINNRIGVATIDGDNVLFDGNDVDSIKYMDSIDYNYSVKINSGNNITITNNELSNNLTYGDEAIEGTADVIENNGGERYIPLDNDSYLNYFTDDGLGITIKPTNYPNAYIYLGHNPPTANRLNINGKAVLNLVNFNNSAISPLYVQLATVNVINFNAPNLLVSGMRMGRVNLINSTVGEVDRDAEYGEMYTISYTVDEDSIIINQLATLEKHTNAEGYLTDIPDSKTIYVTSFDSYDLFIDKNINLTIAKHLLNSDNPSAGTINKTITFLDGSEGSNITNVIFNEKVYVNTSNINFTNCTFNKGIIFNNASENILEKNIIISVEEDTPVVFINSSNNQILNNNVLGYNGVTISLDSDSTGNNIKGNTLNATTKYNIDSVNGRENNIFEGNGILYDVNINIEFVTPFYAGELNPLNINITNALNNESVENGYVEIWVDDLPYETLILNNGQASTYFTYNAATGTGYAYAKTLKVWYYPTEKYQTKKNTKDFNTIESTGSIVLDDISSSKVGEQITINAKINSSDVIDEGNISFQFADKSISVPVMGNTASVTTIITSAMLDDPTLRVVYEGKAMYAIKSNMTTLTITPGIANIVVDEVNARIGDEIQLTAHVKDINDENINGGLITFSNSQNEILGTAEVVDGIATTPYTFTSEYQGIIVATLTSDYYQSSTNESTAQIRKINSKIILDIPDFITTGSVINVTAKIVDEDGNSISGAPIALTIGSIQYPAYNSDENGTVTMPTAIQSEETIPVIANYAGNDIYASSTTETLIKNKTKTTITLSEINTVVDAPTVITATLTPEDNSIINEGQVTFTLADGTIIGTVDVQDSQASTNYTFLDETETTVTAVFTKTNNYINSTATTTVKVGPMPPKDYSTKVDTSDFVVGQSTTISTSIYYGNEYVEELASNITSGIAIVRVNGKTLRDNQGNVIFVPVENGRIEISNVNITKDWTKPDTTIQAIYMGTDNSEPIITMPTTINVVKPEAQITLEAPTTATAGETITLTAKVTSNSQNVNTGRVAFKLNGKTIKNADGKALYTNVEDGIATIKYTIPPKTKAKEYTLTAVFTDTNYDRKEADATLKVVKA